MLNAKSPRVIARCVGALLLTVTVAAPPAQAGSETGEVIFRLTLEGPVPPTHTFAIECGPSSGGENPCFSVESILIVCSPPTETYNYEPCKAATYEVLSTPPVGQEIDYLLLRWTTPDLAHTNDQPEERLAGSWTVRDGRQVISLGFVYPGVGSPTLPDTAIARP